MFFLFFLKGGGGLLPHSAVRCILEDKIVILLLNPLFSYDNHQVVGIDFLTLIGSTVRCDIVLMYLSLASEETWVETTHAWLFVVKSG